MSSATPHHLYEAARRAALVAWNEIAHFYQGEFRVYEKEGEGPATDADLLADQVIRRELQRDFPEEAYGYLTEETENQESRFSKDDVWIIDPIDGTREFIAGRDDFAVQIGLVRREADAWNPLLGVVYMPRTGQIYGAIRGEGCWGEDAATGKKRMLRVNQVAKLADAQLVMTRNEPGRALQRALGRLDAGGVYQLGSLGVKVVELLEGRASLYLNTARASCKEWDVCAPEILLTEAGGRITNLRGAPMGYVCRDYVVRWGLLASNGVLHNAALQALAPVDEIWEGYG